MRLCEREIGRLEQEHVLGGVFEIRTDASVGTINGLRLGRAPGVPVEWVELNAALGQVVLLVHTLGRLHLPGGEFDGYVLHPHGSLCKVATRREPAKLYDLHGSGQLSTRLFGHASGRGVERGQTLLLACVAELCAHAAREPPPPPRPPAAPLPRQAPVAVGAIGSLVGGGVVGGGTAAEGKKLLAVLAWVLAWSLRRSTGTGRATGHVS